MLKKLRVKFVALTMICVGAVLIAALGLICFLNYQHGVDSVRNALEGSLTSAIKTEHDLKRMLQDQDAGADEDLSFGDSKPLPPEIGSMQDDGSLIPVAIYTTHDGTTFTARGSTATAFLAEDILVRACAEAFASNESFGKAGDYGLYFAKRTDGGTTYLAFADVGSVADWENFAISLGVIGIAALLVFFAISIFFSRWALKPVEDAWKTQRQFVADASHELKTPLTVILANSSILLDHPENTIEQERVLIEGTQEESKRMKELVEEMLSLARLDEEEVRGHETMPIEKVALDELVQKEVLQFESVAFEKAVELELETVEALHVNGDALNLGKLVGILIDNGCKYAGVGGTVAVDLHAQGRSAVLKVRNTGPAISPDDLPHVFDRFWRADRARNGASGSYGLGLSIAQQIAHAHGGGIGVESSEEAGTVFTVTLPLA